MCSEQDWVRTTLQEVDRSGFERAASIIRGGHDHHLRTTASSDKNNNLKASHHYREQRDEVYPGVVKYT